MEAGEAHAEREFFGDDDEVGDDSDAVIAGVGAPPVVAIMVTRDPGPSFEAALASLEAQDYEALSVLVVDNGSADDPTERIADVAPRAFVKRLDADDGFSAAANVGAAAVQGAPFLLLCHDDIALAPDAITQLVAEAFRSNAGIVGPKLVDWDDPSVLRSVGLAVDAYGASGEVVDPGEIDQSQHDIAREVFAVSDACLLVRADVFAAIGGFEERIPYFGEDVDLCWKAHLADATVQFCPRAVVAHVGRFEQRRAVPSRDRQALQHQARSLLTNSSLRRLIVMVPLAAVMSLVEFVGSVLLGRLRHAGDIATTWVWTVAHLPGIVGSRRRLRHARRAPDSAWVSLMRRGNTRLAGLFRSSDDTDSGGAVVRARDARRRARAEEPTTTDRAAVGLAVVAAVVVALGARSLWFGELPSMREFTSVGDSVGSWWNEWWTGWRSSGLGESAVPPGVVPGLGLLGTVFLGAVGAARRILLLAPLVIGAAGAWRLLGASRSVRARASALVVYSLAPVMLNALGEARLQALVAWAAAPWVLRRVAEGAGLEPFAGESAPRAARKEVAVTALVLTVVVAISPMAGAVVVLGLLAVLVGPAVSGHGRGALRAAGHLLVAALGAALVALPWLVAALRRGDAATLTGLWQGGAAVPSSVEMLTGSLGSVQTGVFGWGVLVAAAVPLFTGAKWRFGWALGGWVAVLASLAVATWAGSERYLAGAGVELMLVPMVLGLAVAVAMLPLAFEVDVVRSDFGFRQIASFLGIAALVVGLVPVLVAAADGRWYLPEGDFARALDLVDDGDDFRVLWVGDPDVLPVSGWDLRSAPRVAFGFSEGMDPTMSQRWRLDGGTSAAATDRALSAAVDGRLNRLGQILAPMAVDYVVVVDRPAPEPFAPREVAPPAGVLAALGEQLDLAPVSFGDGAVVYQVLDSWAPRSDVSDTDVPAEGDGTILQQLARPPVRPPAVLGDGFGTAFSGELESGAVVAQAVTADQGWGLEVDGEEAEAGEIFGWAPTWSVESGGAAELAWSTPVSTRVLQGVQIVALIGLLLLAGLQSARPAARRARRIVADDGPLVVVEEVPSNGPEGEEDR